MILQDPMASLNPLFSIYRQVAEPAYYHQGMRGRSLRQRVQNLLRAVRIPSPEMRMREYPHQMSGGMRQRVVGAIAMAGGPKLITADEPTTNLDVTIQAQYWRCSRTSSRRVASR
jgi:ABC-type dipeptide/oligopeptide/nickel transport system ATPase component